MNFLRLTAKRIAAHCLPLGLKNWLRRKRAPGIVRGFSESEWPLSAVARALVAAGDTVVDVGANMGYLTGMFARWVGPSGRVVSMEPVPETFAMLQAAVTANGLTRVTCIQAAASDTPGEGTMRIPRFDHGEDNLYGASLDTVPSDADDSLRTVKVQRRTVDEVVGGDADRVTLVKVDVEGHEAVAVRGANRLVETVAPAWIVEVSGDPDDPSTAAASLMQWFREREYGIYRWDGTSLREREPGERSVDYVFLRPKHRALLARNGISVSNTTVAE